MMPSFRVPQVGTTARAGLAAMGFVLLILAPTNGYAQTSPAPSSQQGEADSRAEERMLELNEAGFTAFAEGDFVEAAQTFEEAHTHIPDPILRKNAAIAWFKADRCEEASKAAAFFLVADEMNTRDRIEARSVLGHCRLDRADEALEDGHIDRAQAIVERVSYLETDERVEERLAAARMRLVEARAGSSASAAISAREMAGWAMVAGGAAVLAGNLGYHLLSRSKQDQLDSLADDSGDVRRRDLEDHVDTANWLVPTLYGVGSVTTGGGLWLALSGDAGAPQETQEPAALKAPAPGLQLNFSWRF